MNARKIKHRIHASMTWRFAQMRLEHVWIIDIEAYDSFGPTNEFDSLLESLGLLPEPLGCAAPFDEPFVRQHFPHAEMNAIIKH